MAGCLVWYSMINFVPDEDSNRCQRWWPCRQIANWGRDLLLWCWARRQSTLRLGHWRSLAVYHGLPLWWFLQDREWNRKKVTDGIWIRRLKNSWNGSALTVKTQVLEIPVSKIVLHDGHECGHLTEKQHFVVGGSQLGQDAIQQLKLAGGAVQVGPERGVEETMSPICDIFMFACGVQQQEMHKLRKEVFTYPVTTPPE